MEQSKQPVGQRHLHQQLGNCQQIIAQQRLAGFLLGLEDHLLIQEEDGKQSITLTTPKGSVIAVDDSTESCKISDKDGKNMLSMDYKNGKITIQSEKNISLKAGSAELTMDGNAGAVSLKAKKVTVTADNEIGLKANSALKAEGAQVDVKGQAKINLQASGPVAIKGAVVQIN